MHVLVTGGAGYIGSHAVRELDRCGFEPIVLDNLSEGHREALLGATLVEADLGDEEALDSLFSRFKIGAVMHFAARCYVGESVEDPKLYYEQNFVKALTLLRSMLRNRVSRLIFSSTCATYGEPIEIPIDESHPQNPVNPYGESKYFLERVLKEYARAYGLRSVSLRYFNAAGASLDGRIGESHDPETHLIPLILKVARGDREFIEIYGDDYDTKDGTCVRDYIHVVDLARAHVRALQYLQAEGETDFFNLGTGTGFSVREMVAMAEKVTGREVAVRVGPRRPGDPPELVADASKAAKVLDWKAESSGLEEIFESAWVWEQNRKY